MAVPVPEWIIDIDLIRSALGPDAGQYVDADLTSDKWVIPAWNTILSMCPSVVDVVDLSTQRQFAVALANMVASSLIRSSVEQYMSSSRLGESSVSFREGAWSDRADGLDDRAMGIINVSCPSGVYRESLPDIFRLARGGRALRGARKRWF